MRFIASSARALSAAQRDAIAAYRHRVFVEGLGWPLASSGGQERDQFDRPDTVYALALGADGALRGCARLLPTAGDCLARSVFSARLHRVPAEAETWELTRFAADASAITSGLLHASFLYAASRGARRLLTISPQAITRLLRRRGIAFRVLCTPFHSDGRSARRSYSAFLLDIPPSFCVATKSAVLR